MPVSILKKYAIAFFTLFALMLPSLFAAGDVADGKVSTYLRGAYQDVASVESKLKGAGFEVVGKDTITPDLTSVVFTCPTLKKLGSASKRGFGAVMHVLVNKKDNEISVTNPLYFEKAFLQGDFDEASAKKVLAKINTAFPGLKDSKDSLKYSDLEKYHFMFGMPYYEDMEKIGSGAHDALVQKAQNSGKAVFVLPLANGNTLVGCKLSKRTAKFVKKTGTRNAALLPYTVLIEGDNAYILAPKYYLALSNPQLKMSQFMKIATVPGKITKECSALFK
ncbi:MAG: hypothetical protein DSZ05_00310 [Sulfurospirillum sp.]|nr:MAG: hypothetical protein DSZ05_00310 [Sulfurospirillum sp.]